MARRKPDILWAVAALVWAVAGLALWIWWTIEARWDGMPGKIERYRAESRVQRPPPWEAPEPGDAWEAYLPAMKQAWGATGGSFLWGSLSPVDSDWDDDEGKEARAILAAHRRTLEALAEGARRLPGGCPPEDEDSYRRARALGELARIDFLRHLQDASPGESLEALQVLIKYAWDLAWTPEATGFEQYGRELLEAGMVAAARLLESGTLQAANRDDLCRILERVDVAFPRMRPTRLSLISRVGAVMRGLEPLVSPCGGGASWYSRAPGWRHLWSRKLLMAASFEELESMIRQGADADRLPWSEARSLEERQRADIQRTRGVFLPEELESGVAPDADLGWRRLRMLVRIVRMAAIYRATGQQRMLEDPGEGWIRVTREGEDVVFGTVEPVSLQCRSRSPRRVFAVKVRP